MAQEAHSGTKVRLSVNGNNQNGGFQLPMLVENYPLSFVAGLSWHHCRHKISVPCVLPSLVRADQSQLEPQTSILIAQSDDQQSPWTGNTHYINAANAKQRKMEQQILSTDYSTKKRNALKLCFPTPPLRLVRHSTNCMKSATVTYLHSASQLMRWQRPSIQWFLSFVQVLQRTQKHLQNHTALGTSCSPDWCLRTDSVAHHR